MTEFDEKLLEALSKMYGVCTDLMDILDDLDEVAEIKTDMDALAETMMDLHTMKRAMKLRQGVEA